MTNLNNPQAASDVTDAEVHVACMAAGLYAAPGSLKGVQLNMRYALESFLQSRAASAQNAPLQQDVINYVKGIYDFLESTSPTGFADEAFRLPPAPTRNQRSLSNAITSHTYRQLPPPARQNTWAGGSSTSAVEAATSIASAQNAAPVALLAEPVEMSPEFTDNARAALLWVLWHHQGANSPVGLPIRFALGMGQFENLTSRQIAEAKRFDSLKSAEQRGDHERVIELTRTHTTPPVGAGGSVGAGWKLVPLEPTKAMIYAGQTRTMRADEEDPYRSRGEAIACYSDMVAVAPIAPAPAQGDAKDALDAARFVAVFAAMIRKDMAFQMTVERAMPHPKTLDEVRHAIDAAMVALAAKGQV